MAKTRPGLLFQEDPGASSHLWFPELQQNISYLDQLVIFQPGDVRFGVSQGDAGQHGFGFQQQGDVGRMSFDLRFWWREEGDGIQWGVKMDDNLVRERTYSSSAAGLRSSWPVLRSRWWRCSSTRRYPTL